MKLFRISFPIWPSMTEKSNNETVLLNVSFWKFVFTLKNKNFYLIESV